MLLSAAVLQLHAQQTETSRKPFEELKAKAEAGDANSESQLGLRYAKGQGVAKDEVEAVKWFPKAAEQNEAIAQDNQGKPLEGSVGFFDASPEGVDRARQEAAQGHEEHVIRNGETELPSLESRGTERPASLLALAAMRRLRRRSQPCKRCAALARQRSSLGSLCAP
jgi:Sel1 repeat.